MNYPTLTPGDLKLKDRITNYVKGVGLVDLEALVTPELLTLRGFVDVTNLFSEEEMSSMLKRQREQAQCSRGRGTGSSTRRQTRYNELPPTAPRSPLQREQGSSLASRPQAERRVETVPIETQRHAREDSDAEDDVPLIQRRLNTGSQSGAVRSPDAPTTALLRRYPHQQIARAPESHTMRALATLRPTVNSRWSRLADSCKQLTSDKASLEDEVNCLQSSEMANRAASAESWADELANKAAMDEVVRAVDSTKKAEAERDSALNDLNTLRRRVAVADQDLARVEEGLRKAKTQHQHCISIARAQGAKWLVGADMFQDAVVAASMNTTTEIYNDVRGKVLKHQPDFPINELAFFEGEELDEEGKSLAAPANTTERLRWELNE
ncbi:hypothetical protein SLEP1_g58602 [Rubroshorea leprosula]|nr:hypothetical protein SLEP1_g58602 [Rubroshorea leprosula]